MSGSGTKLCTDAVWLGARPEENELDDDVKEANEGVSLSRYDAVLNGEGR